MSVAESDVVPLPDELSHCGCKFAPRRHAITCAVAIAFDSVPLQDRPEYAPGRRFAAISWDFPLRIEARVNVEVEIDPVAFIAEHADEYRRFQLDTGYQAWEKPMAFICDRIIDSIDFHGISRGRRVSHDHIDISDIEEFPRWEREDTERLDAAIARVPMDPGPNQGKLDV